MILPIEIYKLFEEIDNAFVNKVLNTNERYNLHLKIRKVLKEHDDASLKLREDSNRKANIKRRKK
jgi:hypothetical protein